MKKVLERVRAFRKDTHGAAIVEYGLALLVVAGIKRQTLGWSLNFPDNGNQETFETLEQMRVRALDYLNQP